MSADAAAAEARTKGMYVSLITFESSDLYQCTLRRLQDRPFFDSDRRTVYVRRGKGKTIEAAIRNAMQDDFVDILG